MRLEDYNWFIPPHMSNVEILTPKQAKEYFVWFMSELPYRLTALQRACRSNGAPELTLDFSLAALNKVGEWFGRNVWKAPRSAAEMQAERETLPHRLKKVVAIAESDLSDETASLCADMGIYFAETLRARHDQLIWDYVKKRTSMDLNQPSLFGFKGGMNLNPIRIATVVAEKAIDGQSAGQEWTRLLDVWSGLVV